MMRTLLVLLSTALFGLPAFAQEPETAPAAPQLEQEQPQQEQSFTEQEQIDAPAPQALPFVYAPEACEFTASFPEEPYKENICNGGESGTECYDRVSYTKNFDLAATVYVRVICNEVSEDIKNKYDEAVMIKTLEAMTDSKISETFQTSYKDDPNGRYKLAGLIGESMKGVIPSIYIAQMWLGIESAMTIEAELIGEPYMDADALFRDILQSIRHKEDVIPSGAEKVEEKSEKKAE